MFDRLHMGIYYIIKCKCNQISGILLSGFTMATALLLFSQSALSNSLQPHRLQHTKLPCHLPISQSLLKLMSIESVMPSNHLILCRPLLLPLIFQSIRVVLVVKNLIANAGDTRDEDLIPGSGRSPRGGQGNPLQYSCLENPHGQRSLAGYSPQGCMDLDMTEVNQHACIPETNII